jgi:hypothetical protein
MYTRALKKSITAKTAYSSRFFQSQPNNPFPQFTEIKIKKSQPLIIDTNNDNEYYQPVYIFKRPWAININITEHGNQPTLPDTELYTEESLSPHGLQRLFSHKVLLRGDQRSPDKILAEGLCPMMQAMIESDTPDWGRNVRTHRNGTTHNTGLVSFTDDISVARQFARNHGYIYMAKVYGAIIYNINAAEEKSKHKSVELFPEEREFSVPNGVKEVMAFRKFSSNDYQISSAPVYINNKYVKSKMAYDIVHSFLYRNENPDNKHLPQIRTGANGQKNISPTLRR